MLDKIKSSNKQIVKAPTTYLEKMAQLKYFAGACNIFFGEYSAATTSINALITVTQKFKQTFKANKIDNEFVSQFLFAVDKRMQMWFKSIASANDCADVDDSPLNFSSLVDSVRYGNFHQRLPPTFSGNDEGKKRQKLPSSNLEHDPKKPKTNTAIVNKHPSPELKLLPGEIWVSNFANKHEGRPWWNVDQQVRMCACWHILGR
jgi:hypothetical protein